MTRLSALSYMLLAVLTMCLYTHFYLFPQAIQLQIDEAERSLDVSGRLLQQLEKSQNRLLLAKISELSGRRSLQSLLASPAKETVNQDDWFVKLRAEVAGMVASAREVAPVKDIFVIDKQGVGLVWNNDSAWSRRPVSSLTIVNEAIQKALSGQRRMFVFMENSQLYRGIMVPIGHANRVWGLLYVNFPLDDMLLQAQSSDLAHDVRLAYITQDAMPADNLSDQEQQAVQAILEKNPVMRTNLLQGVKLSPRAFEIADTRYLLAGFPISADANQAISALVLIRPIDKLQSPYGELSVFLFLGGVLVFLMLAVIAVFFGGRVIRGLQEVEQQLDEMDETQPKRIKIAGPHLIRSIARKLNRLLSSQSPGTGNGTAKKTGTPEEAAMEVVVETQVDVVESLTATDGERKEADEDTHYRDVFEQFRHAKAQVGDDLSKLGYERFKAKLQRQAATLKDLHNCKTVQFQVNIKSQKVRLTPRIIR